LRISFFAEHVRTVTESYDPKSADVTTSDFGDSSETYSDRWFKLVA
jgi:hypothetical protein